MLRIEKVFLQGFKSFCDPTEVVFDDEGITAVVGPNGCGKCVDGTTLVTLADGREVQIRELVEQALIDSRRVETLDDGLLTRENPHRIEILSLNPQTLKLESRPVAGFVKREATPHLLRIRTRSGREVSATPYHPLFTLDHGYLRALKAEELQIGTRIALPRLLPVSGQTPDLKAIDVLGQFIPQDRIFIRTTEELRTWATRTQNRFGSRAEWVRQAGTAPRSFDTSRVGKGISAPALAELARISASEPPLNGKIKSSSNGELAVPRQFTPELARFLGLLIAEGRNTESNQVWFVNTDPAVNTEFACLAKQLFGLTVHQYQYKPKAIDSLIYSHALGAMLERLFHFPVASNSVDKVVPPQVFVAPAETKWAFLSGLFEGDAYISARPQPDGRRPMGFIEYVTASPKLAQQVTSLLLQLGVFALVRPHEKAASNTEQKRRRIYYSVLIYGSDQVRFAAEQLSFVGEKAGRLQTLRQLPPASNPNLDLVPSATSVVKEAVRLAGVKLKANRKGHPKLAAYVEGRCEASRNGLREVRQQIADLGTTSEMAIQQLNRLDVLSTSDVYWDEIISIEQIIPSDPWVYDLSVAETHNFVAGNIIVHNSNIADAVNWVIGEQRARALRGGKMEDVIFQGSRNRQPAGMAEVLLTMKVHETFEIRAESGKEIVPSQAEAPVTEATVTPLAVDAPSETAAETPEPKVDEEPKAEKPKTRRRVTAESASRVFQEGEQVTVGRRLYRTGESEYELNGRACRLRDIQDLFAGTGLSGAHYAIIEQGRIGQVLSAKPLDRRALIEDAAGISKFKMRQHAAELKLDAARTNLSRIADIIAEIERQQNSLKRQAARARRYQRLRAEMRDLMRAVYVADYRATRSALGELAEQWDAVAARETSAQARIMTLETDEVEVSHEARAAEARLNGARSAAANVDLDTARTNQEQGYLTEQLQALAARAQQFDRERETIAERSDFIAQETSRLRSEWQAIEGEINIAGLALAADEEEHRTQLDREAEAEQQLEALRRRLYEMTTHLERWRQLQRQFGDAVHRYETRLNGLGIERERATVQAEANEQERATLDAGIQSGEARQAEIRAGLTEALAQLAIAHEDRSNGQQALANAQRELTAVEHRLKSLVELDERHAHFPESVQLLLNRGRQGGGDVDDQSFRTLGTLSDFVQVDPAHESMIETALRDELQYILVPGFDDALRALDFLKAENAGRATFMVVGLRGGEGSASIISNEWENDGNSSTPEVPPDQPAGESTPATPNSTSLLDLLNLPPEFASVFARALPRLAHAQIVETSTQAIETTPFGNDGENSEGAIFVTRQGERVVSGRLVTGGTSAERGGGVLALKREIAELTGRFTEVTTAVAAAEDELRGVEERIHEFDAQRAALDAELRQVEKELAVQRAQQQQNDRDRDRITTHLRIIGQEVTQVEGELAEDRQRLAQATTQTEEAEREHTEAESTVSTAQAEMIERRRLAAVRAQELSRRRADFAARTERRRGLQQDLNRLENEARDLDERFHRSQLAKVETEERIKLLQANLAETNEQLTTLTARQTGMTGSVAELSAALAALRERLDGLDLELRAAREESTRVREERAHLELERVRLNSALEHLAESCHHELGEELSAIIERLEAAPSLSSPSPEEMVTHVSEESGEEEGEEDATAETDLIFWQTPENFDLVAAKARLDELRAKIDALGPINMMALEELTEVEERYRFLVAQKADIEQAIADTQAAIAEIKRRSRERFAEAFYAINLNFQQMFQELFGGGRGEMRLIDETDILESGIEIIAQPPGKRLQNVLLLSGGEKAMAAISLVLAIFKYRPSPFCILDEVDAPLDEVNIGRFSDKVLEMSEKTQFMIITHSKRTMEAARTLYGVTMEDPGVSKLISVRLT